MRFICTKENFSIALNMVLPLTGRGAHLPILTHVLIVAHESHVELTATNLEVAVRATLRAKIEVPGTFSVPAKTLTDYISLIPDGQVEVALDGAELVIVC